MRIIGSIRGTKSGLADFPQTTYPPLTHQWIALFSHIMGLEMAYMFVQLIAILLLPVGMYRYARLWVDECRPVMPRWARSFWVRWRCWCTSRASCRRRRGGADAERAALLLQLDPSGRFTALLKGRGHSLGSGGGTSRHAFSSARSCSRCRCWLAILIDTPRLAKTNSLRWRNAGRAVVFAVVAVAGVAIVLLPYFIALLKNPINQMPIPHGSRDNYILKPIAESISGSFRWAR